MSGPFCQSKLLAVQQPRRGSTPSIQLVPNPAPSIHTDGPPFKRLVQYRVMRRKVTHSITPYAFTAKDRKCYSSIFGCFVVLPYP